MTNTQKMVPLKDLNLTDRFLFDETMQDAEAHQAALSIIFSRKIGLLPQNETEKQLQTAPYLKSVRLDIFSMDEDDTVYNTEMQKWRKADLRKRSRFYQALIDSSLLPVGSINYNQLKDSYIVMITPFDIFGLEKYQYTFESVCKEAPELCLNDGATRIFLNTKGKNPEDVSEELIEFLKYVENSDDETAAQTRSDLVRKIHERVSEIKRSEEIGVKYMQAWEEKAYEREEALEEGREEGEVKKVIEQTKKKLDRGMDVVAIAEHLEESVDFVEKIVTVIRENPSAEPEEILEMVKGL